MQITFLRVPVCGRENQAGRQGAIQGLEGRSWQERLEHAHTSIRQIPGRDTFWYRWILRQNIYLYSSGEARRDGAPADTREERDAPTSFLHHQERRGGRYGFSACLGGVYGVLGV